MSRLLPHGRAAIAALVAALALALASSVVLATASWSSIDVPWRDDALPEDAVMRVADTVVTTADLETRLEALRALYGVQTPTDPDDLDRFRRDAAKSLAVSIVVEDAARARGIVVSRKQAQAELATLVSEQLGGDRAAFLSYLATNGVTEDQVLAEMTRTLVNQRLYSDVTADVPAATEAEARATYEERRSQMRSPERRRLANIVVAQESQARAALAQLRAGEPFAAVTRAFSLDDQTRESGGGIGLLSQDQLEPGYAEAAFAAKPGVPFGPVQTEAGWNVGLVQQVQPGRALSFEEVADTLRQALSADRALTVWRDFMRQALADAAVEYAPDYRPSDPDALPSDVLEQPAS